mgnify:CR=1 FL=1
MRHLSNNLNIISDQNLTYNPKTPLKIGIIGAGPVGLTLSAHFIESGAYVVLCDIDEEKIDEIKKVGISLINTIQKNVKVDKVCYSVNELKKHDLDLVIISVKTTVLQVVVDQLSKTDDEKLFVMCAQNGIDNELIAAEKFGEDKTLRMVINYAGAMENPNTVNITFFNPPNYIAPITSTGEPFAKTITDLLNGVNLVTEMCDSNEIKNHVWEKAILNSALSGICAISHRTMKEVMSFPETVDMVIGIIDESIQVAKRENIEIKDGFRSASIEYLTKAGDHKPSMLIDIENGVKTEIDQLNGKIVKYGKKYGIDTPLNQGITALIHLHEEKNNG